MTYLLSLSQSIIVSLSFKDCFEPLQIDWFTINYGFPCSSVGKESACNAGDPSLSPGSGRSAGEGTGYPLQYSWAFLVAQLVKNLPTMWETWVRSLSWENPLEKGMATTPVFWPGESPWTEEPGGLQSMGSRRVRYD